MKKILSLALSLIMAFSVFSICGMSASARTYREELLLAGFTEEYVDDLVTLHTKYPNWSFIPILTNEEFADTVKAEKPSNSSVSEANLKKYLNPTMWMDEMHIFQFESIRREDQPQTVAGVEGILNGSWMGNKIMEYNSTENTTKYVTKSGKKINYSEAMMDAAQESGLSAYYISTKIRQENGVSYANAIKGTVAPFYGIYNFFNIGANTGAIQGLHYASGAMWAVRDTIIYSEYDATAKKAGGTQTKINKNTGSSNVQYMCYIGSYGDYLKVRYYEKLGSNSYSTNGVVGYVLKADTDYDSLSNSYQRPWYNPYRSIINGAKWIANGYLGSQYTLYFQKFNVNPESGSNLHKHEYMTHISGAVEESAILYNGYKRANLLSSKHTFYIPVFKNIDPNFVPTTTTTTTTTTQPVKVPAVTGLAQSGNTASTVTIKWNKASGVSGYYIYQYDSAKKTYTKVATTGSSAYAKKLSGLKAGTTYYYAIAAYITKNGSTTTGSKSAKISTYTKPATVTLSSLTSLSNHGIKATWKKASGSATGYQIYWARDKAFKSILAKTTVSGQSKVSYTGKNFTKGKTYYVKVRAYKTIGGVKKYGAWSNVKYIKAK